MGDRLLQRPLPPSPPVADRGSPTGESTSDLTRVNSESYCSSVTVDTSNDCTRLDVVIFYSCAFSFRFFFLSFCCFLEVWFWGFFGGNELVVGCMYFFFSLSTLHLEIVWSMLSDYEWFWFFSWCLWKFLMMYWSWNLQFWVYFTFKTMEACTCIWLQFRSLVLPFFFWCLRWPWMRNCFAMLNFFISRKFVCLFLLCRCLALGHIQIKSEMGFE